jgi:hypothetical protein
VPSTKAKSGHKIGRSEPEGKIPDKHELQGEKNSSESEVQILGTEKPDYVQREDSVPEGIVNRRQGIDTPAVPSTKAKSGHKFGKSEPERKIPDKHELQGEKNSSASEVHIMGTEKQGIDTPAVPSTKAKSGHKFGKSEPERKIPDKHELQGEKNSSASEVHIMGTEKPDYVQREDSVPEEIVNR